MPHTAHVQLSELPARRGRGGRFFSALLVALLVLLARLRLPRRRQRRVVRRRLRRRLRLSTREVEAALALLGLGELLDIGHGGQHVDDCVATSQHSDLK